MKHPLNWPKSWGVLAGSLAIAFGITLSSVQSASAQNINSFQVVGDVTPFDFSVNGTGINSTTGANLTGYLHTGANSTNTLTVGWNPPPQGSYIELKYTGTGSYGFGNTTVTNGDILRVYGIAGAYLSNTASIGATGLNGNSLIYWNGSTATNNWNSATNANYVGYSTSWSANSPFLGYSNTGSVDGKSFANAAKDGQFTFNGLSLGNAATYLGLDIYAQVYDSTNTTELSTAGTGRVDVQSFAPGSVAPEGSSLALIAAGLLPLAWQGRRILKRRTSPQ